jgi:hypothetical protein
MRQENHEFEASLGNKKKKEKKKKKETHPNWKKRK